MLSSILAKPSTSSRELHRKSLGGGANDGEQLRQGAWREADEAEPGRPPGQGALLVIERAS